MKKSEQIRINQEANNVFAAAMKELCPNGTGLSYGHKWAKRLRSCQAWVYETPGYYILESYETIVGCIRKSDGLIVDVLRTEYGYTATSAKHIAAFRNDYCHVSWDARRELRTYPV